MPFNQKQIIEQAKFTYSPLVKAFAKQIKTIKDQEEEQTKTKEIKKDIKEINKLKQLNLIKVLTMNHIKYLISFLMKE